MDSTARNDWCLGFEEMEPCCQKEILMQRKEAEFRRKIREFDRSNLRNSTRDEVFSKMSVLSNCACCQTSKDYPLLESLRRKQNVANQESDSISNHSDAESDLEDELDMDDYKSPAEAYRLEQVKTCMIRQENYQLLGYGIHVMDSVSHILTSMQDISTPMIVHIVDPQQKLCALLDLALESLAAKFWGCRFRRILLADSQPLVRFVGLDEVKEPVLLCWKERSLVECITIRRHFDTGDDFVAVADVEAYLDHLHMLAMENPEVMQLQIRLLNGDDDDDDDNDGNDEKGKGVGGEYVNSYCGEQGCGRTFPHSHVGSDSQCGGGSSLLSGHDSMGADAFEQNHFLKI